tara:strand:- start:70 stop:342 length:273 start_codon:yes stop_codon:yes gene_type:complete
MPEEVKFTQEELAKVKDIRVQYSNIQNSFGQLKMAQIRLDEQEVQLEESLKNIQTEESKFLDGITKKYGDGSLNPDTGVFTPTASENKSE